MHSQRSVEPSAALGPVPAQPEMALVTAVLAVDQEPESAFHYPNAQGDEPTKGNADTQKQTRQAILVPQTGGFQVKAMSFHISVHFFNPHADLHPAQALVTQAVGHQVPGIVFTRFPMQHQPEPTCVMLLGQAHPAHIAGFVFRQVKGIEFLSTLIFLIDLDRAFLPDDEVPTPLLEPAQQRHMLKLRISHHPDLSISRQQRGEPDKQGPLGFHVRRPPPPFMHAPNQRQSAFAIGAPNDQQSMTKVHFRSVNDQANALPRERRYQLLRHWTIPFFHIHRCVGQKAPQAVHQTEIATGRQGPLTDNVRQMNVGAQTQTRDQQRQVSDPGDPGAFAPLDEASNHLMIEAKVVGHAVPPGL